MIEKDALLPTGVIVGSAVIESVEEIRSWQLAVGREKDAAHLLQTANRRLPTVYAWKLGGVRRASRLRKPTGHPQPVWFEPFKKAG